MPKRSHAALPAYPPKRFAEILDVLSRASKERADVALKRLASGKDELEAELLSLVHATGLAHDGSEEGELWHEALGAMPSPLELASGFRAMARSSNPLDPKVCRPDLRSHLNASIRMRWASRWKQEGRRQEPSVQTIDWEALSAAEKEEIRMMVRHLRDYFSDQVPGPGSPRKSDFDTALADLASIFLRYTGRDCRGQFRMRQHLDVQFRQFAEKVLKAAAPEVTDQAIANRWNRLKAEKRKRARPIGQKPKKKRPLGA